MKLFNSYVINPAVQVTPTYRISPFNSPIYFSNSIEMQNRIEYFRERFPDKSYVYTKNGREAINLALRALSLNREDEVAIFTTSGNFYISSCVTKEIEKFCGWKRQVNKNTKAILINHEFGFILNSSSLREIKKYNLPIIEDFAHSFNSKVEATVGDFLIYSLSKFFPVQVGGVCVYAKNWKIKSKVDSPFDQFLLCNTAFDKVEVFSKKRIKNYLYLAGLFSKINMLSYFELDDNVPGVFLFKADGIIDLAKLKIYMQNNGVESGVFYGVNAYFIPCHHNLEIEDLDFFYSLIVFYLKNENSVIKEK